MTAEGVEEPGGLRAIDLLGVDSAQGYLLARPTTDPWEWAGWATTNWSAALSTAALNTSTHG